MAGLFANKSTAAKVLYLEDAKHRRGRINFVKSGRKPDSRLAVPSSVSGGGNMRTQLRLESDRIQETITPL